MSERPLQLWIDRAYSITGPNLSALYEASVSTAYMGSTVACYTAMRNRC